MFDITLYLVITYYFDSIPMILPTPLLYMSDSVGATNLLGTIMCCQILTAKKIPYFQNANAASALANR